MLRFFFSVIFIAHFAFAGERHSSSLTLDAVVKKGLALFNKKKFHDCLAWLEPYRSWAAKNPKWYFVSGICNLKLQRYDESEKLLEQFVKKVDINDAYAAKGYYFLGLSSFNKNEFQKALNTFQTAQDISRDNELDKVLDIQMEKSIRFRDYYENHKPGKLDIFLGYELHKNTLMLSPAVISENLSGHVFSYGFLLGYRAIDRMNFVIEPTFLLLDRYTLNKDLKEVSALRATDALLALVSVPIYFTLGNNNSKKYEISLSGYSTYLPITTSHRELNLFSAFAKGKFIFDVTSVVNMEISISSAAEKGFNFTTDDNDSTGSKTDLSILSRYFLDLYRSRLIMLSLNSSDKGAVGRNMRSQRFTSTLSYFFPGIWDSTAGAEVSYESLKYADQVVPRNDSKVSVDFSMLKRLDENSYVGYLAGADVNSSDNNFYDYDDYFIGFRYGYNLNF